MQTSQIFSKNQNLFGLIKVSFTVNTLFLCQQGVNFLLVSSLSVVMRWNYRNTNYK